MARPGLQQIVLDDFSAGMYDDWHTAGGPMAAPQGAAQVTGTYGCVAGKGGGLIPGPRRVNRVLETLFDADGSTKYPLNDNRVHITRFRCASPVWDRSAVPNAFATGTPNPFPDNLAFGFDWYYNGAGGTSWRHRQRVRLYKMFLAAAANPAQGALTQYNLIDTTSTNLYSTKLMNGYCGIDLSRSRTADPTGPGFPIIAAMTTDNREVTTFARVAYPDDQAGNTDSTRALAGLDQPGGFAAYDLVAHQDRVVALDRSVNFVFGANGEMPTDMLIATVPNDIGNTGVTLSNFVAENPGLFGSWASVNASEMLFVKQQKGGYVLRGDMAYPTIVRLPGLMPTYDAINVPAVCSNGMVVYGSQSGVYGWTGGDVAENLSHQIDGWFWKVPGGTNSLDGVDNFLHTKGTFSAFRQYVAAPNNFLYDSEMKSWWRLNDPTDGTAGNRPYAHYDTSAAGYLIGVPAYFDATLQTIADYYDFDLGQTKFAWKSQPLKLTQNRELDFRDCDLVATGVGTVLVTVTGLGGATTTATFQVNSTIPVAMHQGLGVHAHDAVVTITSTATNASDPAPRVHRVGLGYHDRQTLATGV